MVGPLQRRGFQCGGLARACLGIIGTDAQDLNPWSNASCQLIWELTKCQRTPETIRGTETALLCPLDGSTNIPYTGIVVEE